MSAPNTPVSTVAPRSRSGDERVDQRLGVLGTRRIRPRRAPALAGVAVQRELAHDERGTAGVVQTDVHHALGIVEDPQAPHLVGQPPRRCLVVAVGDADQHAQPRPDLADHGAVHPYSGLGDPLEERTHRWAP